MTQRLNAFQTAPDAYKAMLGLQDYVSQSKLEHSLQELVKIRASQINRCAYCLHMHMADARKAGESEARIERAALRWTEELTRLAERSPSDAAFAELREHFSEQECVDLSVAIGMINVWNRINCGFRTRHPNDRRRESAAA